MVLTVGANEVHSFCLSDEYPRKYIRETYSEKKKKKKKMGINFLNWLVILSIKF